MVVLGGGRECMQQMEQFAPRLVQQAKLVQPHCWLGTYFPDTMPA